MIPLPTPRLLALLAAWAGLGLAAALWPRALDAWRLIALGLGVLGAADALWAFLPRRLRAERELSPSLALGHWKVVTVRIHLEGPLSCRIAVMDHTPEDVEARGQGRGGRLPGGGFLELRYRVRPQCRGRRTFGPVQVRRTSPLGLVAWDLRLDCPQEVQVFPDFAAVARYALLATDHRLAALGILRRQRRGEGMDFHQLREYRPGDSLRRIDWKASSRSRKLISREYQDERDQQVVFLVDCGRRMRALEPGRPGHFDEALNAMFLLAFVALKQGDAVGVATFAEPQPRLLAPRKGLVALDHLFRQLFDLQPTAQASDHLAAAQALRTRLRKRSLVVVLTNLRDEEETTLKPALELLRQTHLVLLANLRESAVDELLATPAGSFSQALAQAAALDWQERREAVLRGLKGVKLVDVPPAELPAALVNRYLELKAEGVF